MIIIIHFHLPKDASNNWMHKIESIINHYEFLVEHTIKKKVRQLLSKYKHGNDIHKDEKQ